MPLERTLRTENDHLTNSVLPCGHQVAFDQPKCDAAEQVKLNLKMPWRDGTTHLVMSPLELMPRPAALSQPGATATAKVRFAAVNLGLQPPA